MLLCFLTSLALLLVLQSWEQKYVEGGLQVSLSWRHGIMQGTQIPRVFAVPTPEVTSAVGLLCPRVLW